MAFTDLAFAGLATYPGWHSEYDAETGSEIEIRPPVSRTISHAVTFVLLMASLLVLVSCLWQHVAAASVVSTVSSITQERALAHVGPAAAVLAWFSLTLIVAAFLGTSVLVLSIAMLREYRDDG